MKFQSASALIILLCSLFVFSAAQGQNCVDYSQQIINPCPGQANGAIRIFNIQPEIGDPPYTFTWNDQEDADSIRTGLTAGSYSLTITAIDGDGECSSELEFDLTEQPPVEINSVSIDNTSCSEASDGNITLSVNGNSESYSYNWSNGSTFGSINNLSAGTYSVTIYGDGNCPTTASFTVEEDPFEINETITDATCSYSGDGSILLSIVGNSEGYIYSWSNGGSPSSFNDNLLPGSYSVTVTSTDNGDCVLSETYEVGAPDPIVVNYTFTDVTCPEESDGTITMDISGGTPPYTHSWSNGDTLPNLTGLSPGTYTDTILDAVQCTTNWTLITIDEPLPITVGSGTSVSDETCVGSADGSIDVAVSGGTPPYSFSWSNGATGEFISGLTAGAYTVTIADADTCEVVESFEIGSLNTMAISCSALEADSSQVDNTGEFQVAVTGGIPPYELKWNRTYDPNINEQSFDTDSLKVSNLYSDRYFITVTDGNGCSDTCSVFVEEYFIVEDSSLFILEFEEDASGADIKAYEEELMQKPGVTRKKMCNCENDTARLQLWYTENRLDINTSGESSTSHPKGDTSGLAIGLLLPEEIIIAPTANICTHPETEPSPDSDTVIVAIIDSGVNLKIGSDDRGHPALTDLQWTNNGETFGDGKDNDQNCLIDDRFGYDYLNESGTVIDSVGHGTHLAGIIANAYPNDINLQIINLKVYGEDENGQSRATVFDLTCAIHYAIEKGANVINLSLGYFDKEPSKVLYRALKRAEENNILVVISAGNDGRDLDEWEIEKSESRWPGRFNKDFKIQDSTLATLNNVIVVAALDSLNNDLDSIYSNYSSTQVDIATNANFLSTHLDANYLALKGTSMSAAYLSRIFSIVLARHDTIPVRSMVKAAISSAEVIGFGGRLISSGRFNEKAFLDSLGIDSIITRRKPVLVPDDLILGLDSVEFLNNQVVNFTVKLGDGKVLFEDVVFQIFDLGKTTNPVYEEHLCRANFLQWKGDHKNGGKVIGGTYQFIVTIGGKKFTRPTNIIIGG